MTGPPSTEARSAFSSYYRALTPREQAGFFVWPSLEGPAVTARERGMLEAFKPSGVVLFKRNLTSPGGARALVSEIRALTHDPSDPFSRPAVVAIDEEGGRVSRLPPPFPCGKPALHFAQSRDRQGLVEQCLHQAAMARELGIGCFLAPVCDILAEGGNQAIGDRCFGTDAATASEFAELAHTTLAGCGLITCAKHFPGHGATRTDTHTDVAISQAGLTELRAREWLPFRALFARGVPLCMVAHVTVPALDTDHPATLSRILIQGFLRAELGFSGLVVSDDLRMRAIALHYRRKGTAVRWGALELLPSWAWRRMSDDGYLRRAGVDALRAGCDIILSCGSIWREQGLLGSVAAMLSSSEDFARECEDKAFRIHATLSSSTS